MQEGLTKHEADVGSGLRLRVGLFQDADPFVRISYADERLGQCQAPIQLCGASAECFSRKARRVFLAALDQRDFGLERESVGFYELNTLGLGG
jgi:hypothetical protein